MSDPKLAEDVWWRMMEQAQSCRRAWCIGFPVISTVLLRKFWQDATGYLPPDNFTDPARGAEPHAYDTVRVPVEKQKRKRRAGK